MNTKRADIKLFMHTCVAKGRNFRSDYISVRKWRHKTYTNRLDVSIRVHGSADTAAKWNPEETFTHGEWNKGDAIYLAVRPNKHEPVTLQHDIPRADPAMCPSYRRAPLLRLLMAKPQHLFRFLLMTHSKSWAWTNACHVFVPASTLKPRQKEFNRNFPRSFMGGFSLPIPKIYVRYQWTTHR